MKSYKLVALLGTASALALSNGSAYAQGASVAEEVLITGTLIRGAQAVGVPVQALGEQQFREQAAVTVSDLVRSVPQMNVDASTARNSNASNLAFNQRISIHGQGGSRTLMLIDGMRFPLQGVYYDGYDPSIIPSIMVQRVDVLTAGASATYGTDAIAGVVNVILRRGYDGAITQGQYMYGQDGGDKWTVAQLYGTTWDGGGITVGFNYYDTEDLKAEDRDQWTWNFNPWGLDNLIPLNSSIPATISTGNATAAANAFAAANGTTCTNCFLVPAGQDGGLGAGLNAVGLPTGTPVSWATLLSRPMVPQTSIGGGVNNLVDPWKYGSILGEAQQSAIAVTFDQEIMEGVSLFVDGFYSNRRFRVNTPNLINPWNGGAIRNLLLPLDNDADGVADYPYRPTGAPAGIRVSYSTILDLPQFQTANEISQRWSTGFNIDLPGDWSSRVFYAVNETKNRGVVHNTANLNNINAALGNVVFDSNGVFMPYVISTNAARKVVAADIAALPAALKAIYPVGSDVRVISPTQVPFLNVMCDPTAFTCNDPRTTAFISGSWVDDVLYQVEQWGANFDGPIFEVPGGEIAGALGFTYVTESLKAFRSANYANFSTENPATLTFPISRSVWAAFGELNVPIFGDGNAIPGIQSLVLSGSLRYDHYEDVGGTTNWKVSGDWEPITGLTIRGAYGTSFSAPGFQYTGELGVKNISAQNQAASGPSNARQICTPAQVTGSAAPTPGTVAAAVLGAIGAANCSDAAITAALAALPAGHPYAGYTLTQVRFPGEITQGGGAAPAYRIPMRPPGSIQPESADTWSVGFDFNPEFLPGLNLNATYWKITIDDYIGTPTVPPDPYNNPQFYTYTFVKGAEATNPVNTPFSTILTAYLNSVTVAGTIPAFAPTISVIVDGMARNFYRQEMDGVDFGARYEFDLADYGTWHVGLNGSYFLCNKNEAIDDGNSSTWDLDSCNLGAPPNRAAGNTGVGNPTGTNASADAPRIRARGNLGWEDMDLGWSADVFVNYRSHYHYNLQPTPSVAVMTQLLGRAPTLQDFQRVMLIPEQYTFDVSVAYDTGDRPANAYLKNLNIRLTVNDILDTAAPFAYRTLGNGAGPLATDGTQFSPQGRIIALTVTKNW